MKCEVCGGFYSLDSGRPCPPPIAWRAWMDSRTENTGSVGWEYRDMKPVNTNLTWYPLFASAHQRPHDTDASGNCKPCCWCQNAGKQ